MKGKIVMNEQDSKGKKDFVIVVNGEKHEVNDDTVTFEQVVTLAYPTPPSEETVFTVTYRGAKKPKEGSLKAGGSVTVKKDGAIFNVTSTTKS
jgi:hypothetical protein